MLKAKGVSPAQFLGLYDKIQGGRIENNSYSPFEAIEIYAKAQFDVECGEFDFVKNGFDVSVAALTPWDFDNYNVSWEAEKGLKIVSVGNGSVNVLTNGQTGQSKTLTAKWRTGPGMAEVSYSQKINW